MQVFNFNYSDIEGLTRLDPEYYDPKYINKVGLVRKLNSLKLKDLFEITLGPAYSSSAISEKGDIPISKIGDVTNKRKVENWDYLSLSEFSKYGSKSIQPNEVLITLTGDPPDVGKVHIPFTEYDKLTGSIAFNQRVGKLRSKDLSPFLLYAILSSEYFRVRFEQCALGIRQRNVSIPDLKNAYVFVPDEDCQESIDGKVKEHFKLRSASEILFQKAQHLLENSLNLNQISLIKANSYTTAFSNVVSSHRLDSNHFKPKFDQLLDHIKASFDFIHLGTSVILNRRGVQPIYIPNGTKKVITSQHITATHLDYDNFEKTSDEHYTASPEAHVKYGDILTYTTGAYVGQTNVYLDTEPAIASNHVNITRLKGNDIDPTYVGFVMNSLVGQIQTEKHIRGSAQAELYPNDMAKFIIPILGQDTMASISQNVKDSLEARRKSKELLEQAKQEVETLIEQAAQTA